MKKRLLSLGMALCMVLTLVPISAFAEENSEVQTCICEAVCTEETRNTDCPVCGAEGAALEDCGKYVAPMTEMPTEEANTETSVESEAQTAADTETTAETEVHTEVATETETQPEAPACTCEAVCAIEAMNIDCPICGVEGTTIENCGKYEAPVEETEPEQTAIEKVQSLINALPTVEELENADEATVNAAYEAAQAVYDALETLNPEELEQLIGIEKMTALLDWFNGQVEVLVEQPPVSYVDENGETQTCNDYTIVTSETSSWGENGKTTWYVVSEDVTLSTVEGDRGFYRAASASGNVNLILCDGVTLTAQASMGSEDVRGIRVNEGASLTIYGQTNGTGTLSAIGTNGTGILVKNSLTINGGIINATGRSDNGTGCGIETQDSGHIIINGGIINATGEWAAIFDYITINGGKVTAIAERGVAIGRSLTLPDSYKWRTAETDEFTTNTCMVSYTYEMDNGYVQIVVPGDERPYHNFDTDGKCECGKVKFTVTFNTNGGSVTPTTATTDISGKLTSLPTPERNGCRFTGWYTDKTGGTEVTETTIFTAHTTIYAHWNDYTAPTGEILLGTNSWNTFLNNISFGLFFKDTQEVVITATDNSGEDVNIAYLLTDKALTADELATATFTVCNDKFTVEPNNEYVIYAKLSDNSGNVTYINSNGIVLDNVAPVISGIANGKTYCKAQTVTVSDKYDVTVTVNGTQITLDANGQFTLSPATGTQTVVATDKAGNVSAEMIVTVNDGHEGGTATCKDKAVCDYCGKPYGELNGSTHAGGTYIKNDKAATCNEDGYTGDTYCKGCETKLQDGKPITKLGHIDADKNHVCDRENCKATLSTCSGGTATCKDKAVCEYCGEPYGGLDSSNHAGGTEVRNAKDATCTEDGYTGDTYCKGCETKLSSGKSVDKTGHDYESKVTKEATTTSTGTKTYTCKNCGHSYEEEIAKLPSQSTSPKTGDETPLVATIVVTLLSAAALIVLVTYKKRGRYSAK